MEKVLIDTFIVPEDSRATFLEQARHIQTFIRTLPGFVDGYLYERKAGESRYNFMTTVVWQSEEAFENAKQAVASENQQRGYNPDEAARRLGIERVRAVYERSAY